MRIITGKMSDIFLQSFEGDSFDSVKPTMINVKYAKYSDSGWFYSVTVTITVLIDQIRFQRFKQSKFLYIQIIVTGFATPKSTFQTILCHQKSLKSIGGSLIWFKLTPDWNIEIIPDRFSLTKIRLFHKNVHDRRISTN